MATQYTLEDLERKISEKDRFQIRFLYTVRLKSQREIAKLLRLSRMHVALYVKLLGLSRPDGIGTKKAKQDRRRRMNMGFAMGAYKTKEERRRFQKDLIEAKELREQDK